MKKTKRLLSVFLVAVSMMQLMTPALAAESHLEDESLPMSAILQNELQVIDNSSYEVTEETVFERNFEPVVDPADVPYEPMPARTYAATAGTSPSNPYTTLNIPDEQLNIIIDCIKDNVQVRAVNYGGEYIYEFTSGGESVYVTCDTFTRARTASISTATSSGVTNNLNNKVNEYTYTTMMKSYYYSWNGLDVYRWSFVRIGVRAHRAMNNSIVYFTTEVEEAYDFDAYVYSVQDPVPCSLRVTPTMTLRISDAKSGVYFDSYEYEGKGENISGSTINIASMVDIGYSAVKLIGTIASTGLTAGNLYSVYNLAVNLIKETSGTRKTYDSINYPLSDSRGYTYKFSVATPFAIRYATDVAQMGMGLTGDTAGTAKFSAALTWAAS